MNNLGSGFKCYSNTHKLVSGPMVLCLNISIFQDHVGKAVVYILQAELVACTIRADSEIQGVKLPGEKMGNVSRLNSACLQMTLNYLLRMMNLSKYLLIF